MRTASIVIISNGQVTRDASRAGEQRRAQSANPIRARNDLPPSTEESEETASKRWPRLYCATMSPASALCFTTLAPSDSSSASGSSSCVVQPPPGSRFKFDGAWQPPRLQQLPWLQRRPRPPRLRRLPRTPPWPAYAWRHHAPLCNVPFGTAF